MTCMPGMKCIVTRRELVHNDVYIGIEAHKGRLLRALTDTECTSQPLRRHELLAQVCNVQKK